MNFPEIPAVKLPETETHTEWLEQRREGIGSSDASVILGLSNYESPYSLWEQKTGRAPLDIEPDERSAELMEWGNILEFVIRDETAKRLGVEIMKPDFSVHHPDRPWQRANLDGWTDLASVFEAKNTDSRNFRLWDEQVPDHAELQVHHSGSVTGARSAIVAGLIGGNRLMIHEVTMNMNVIEILLEAEEEFWGWVQSDTPPPVDGHPRTYESLMRAWEDQPGVKQVDESDVSELWAEFREAHRLEKEAVKRKRYARAKIAQIMDGHNELRSGEHVWAKTQRGQLDMGRLTKEHPKLVDQFTEEVPTFNRDKFRKKHPELFSEFQGITVMPKGLK